MNHLNYMVWKKLDKNCLICLIKMIFINACSFNLFALFFMNEPPLALQAKPSFLMEGLLFFYKMLSHSFYLKLSYSLIKILNPFKNYVSLSQILARVWAKSS